MAKTRTIPEHFHTITPSVVVKGAAQAIEFYKKALGAQELMRMPNPDGKIMHAELKIGDSVIFVSDEIPNMGLTKSPQTLGGCTGALHLYVDDVDASFQRAVDAGAKSAMPVADMFWGDRYGTITDPFGHVWGLATHKEDVSPAEMEERAQKFFAGVTKERKTA